MKRFSEIFSYGILFVVIFLFVPLMAEAETKKVVLKVGVHDYYGLTGEDEESQYISYGREYLEEISTYTGWDYEFVSGNWEQCLQRLADGEIDLLCTAQYSDERAKLYDYTEYEAGTEYAMLLVGEDNDQIFYNDFRAFHGIRIGLLKGVYQNALLPKYASDHGFHYEGIEYNTTEEMEAAVKKGEIDAFLIGSLQNISGVKVVAKFAPKSFYFITTRGNRGILSQLNTSMEQIQTTYLDYNIKLYEKYYGDSSGGKLAFTREEHEYVEQSPSLRVAYPKSWYPIYFSDEEGEFSGICSGLMDKISEESGLKFTYIPVNDAEEAAEMIAEGKADLVCGYPGDNEQDAKNAGILITKPIFEVPVTISALLSNHAGEVRTIAVPENVSYLAEYAAASFPEANVIYCHDTEACVNAVKKKMADAVFDNIYSLDTYNKYAEYSDIQTVLSSRGEFPLCIGVGMEEDAILRSLLNKVIIQISMKDKNDIVINNTLQGIHISPWMIIRKYLFPLLVVMMLSFLLLLLHSRNRIEKYAFVDPVTGHDNGVRFQLSANKILHLKGSSGFSVVNMDINKFKLINNLHSYEIGNRVLQAAADILKEEMNEGELFCREAGDHFLLFLSDTKGCDLDERIRDIMKKITMVPRFIGQSFRFTISCGVYHLQKADKDIHSAIGWASLARNTAKDHHTNWVAYYDETMKERVTKEQNIVECMDSALKNREFEVYLQPKYRLEDEKLVGAEALVRWNKKEGGMIFPDEFIPVFESNGFIIKLDLFVFKETCRLLRNWGDMGIETCPVSVNLSRLHLNVPDFYDPYIEIMHQYGIASNMIEIELTESILFENQLQMVSLIKELKKLGLSVSMDDFGSGYSSLTLLKDLPIDYLKMDKEFFNTASDTERGKKVIESVIYMAKLLDIHVVAEGVETKEQVDYLKSIHCDIVQGYYFSRPMPAGQFELLMK